MITITKSVLLTKILRYLIQLEYEGYLFAYHIDIFSSIENFYPCDIINYNKHSDFYRNLKRSEKKNLSEVAKRTALQMHVNTSDERGKKDLSGLEIIKK